VTQREEQALEAVADNVRAAVGTAIQRQDDLLASVQGMVDAHPDLTNLEFRRWYESAEVAERFPSGYGVGFVERVPVVELPAFAERLEADPARPLAEGERFEVFPEPAAAEVCLQRLTVWRGGEVRGLTVSPGFDLCAREIPGAGTSLVPDVLDRATTTGRAALVPPDQFVDGVLAFFAPVYRGGVTPTSVEERRAQVRGWVGATFSSDLLLAGAGAEGSALVEVLYRFPTGWDGIVSGGGLGSGRAAETTVPVTDGGEWEVRVASTVATSSLEPWVQGVLVALTGMVISGLMFAVVRLLAGSRRRALDLAEASTAELHHLALHDGLTGLANRRLLFEHADAMLGREEGGPTAVAALFLDLDDFKAVNDTFGHAGGDDFLRAVGARLEGSVRSSDVVGRIGGDEFVVLVPSPDEVGGVAQVADHLLDVLHEPIVVEGIALPVSVSLGVACGSRISAAELLRRADLAMYRAKADGKGRVVHYEPSMLDELKERVQVDWDLHRALERDELRLRYQPCIDLATGRVVGLEALVRWSHPTRGLVGPDQFIPSAERTGLIVPVGRWVLQTACREAARLHRDGFEVRMAVNLSARQLEEESVVDDVERTLAATGLEPCHLVLEITETSLMRDVRTSEARLRALTDLGVRLSVDDFGTGYSSMAYLQRFPVDQLKIDRSFIADLPGSEQAAALVRTLLQLARALDLETVAEGIERVDQWHHLVELGCDSGQGYLFAPPLDATSLRSHLARPNLLPRQVDEGLRTPR